MRFDLDRDAQIPETLYLIQLVLEACVEAGASRWICAGDGMLGASQRNVSEDCRLQGGCRPSPVLHLLLTPWGSLGSTCMLTRKHALVGAGASLLEIQLVDGSLSSLLSVSPMLSLASTDGCCAGAKLGDCLCSSNGLSSDGMLFPQGACVLLNRALTFRLMAAVVAPLQAEAPSLAGHSQGAAGTTARHAATQAWPATHQHAQLCDDESACQVACFRKAVAKVCLLACMLPGFRVSEMCNAADGGRWQGGGAVHDGYDSAALERCRWFVPDLEGNVDKSLGIRTLLQALGAVAAPDDARSCSERQATPLARPC